MSNTASGPKSPFAHLLALAAASCAAYLGYVLILYGNLEGYLDHTEPNIAIGAWRFLGGYSLFQGPDEWPIFGSYGPLLNLIHSAVFNLAGGSIPMSKLANSLASAGSVLILFIYALNRFGAAKASLGVLLFIALMGVYSPFSFWNRPDPFILFLVTLAVFAKDLPAGKWGRWTPHVVVGFSIGLAVNLKVHSFIYFIPVAVDLCGWKGVRQMIVIGLISIAVFLLPFAHPQISLSEYIAYMFGNLSVREGFDKGMFLDALRYSLFFLSPGFLLAGLLVRGGNRVAVKDAIYFAALALSTALALYPSSSLGMGSYHLLPLLAITMDALLRFLAGYDDAPRLQKGLLVLLPVLFLAVSIPVQRRLMRNLDRMARENVAEEVASITKRYQNESLQVGYGQSFESYRFSFFKVIPMFAGQPVTVDPQLMMEFNFIGLDLSPKLAADIEACQTRHWLIPKGEKPFSLQSYYTGKPLFGRTAQVFQERYQKSDSLDFYDVWSCPDTGP